MDKAEIKPDSLLNLDDLLQCPVCYEIPLGQIFQCNEGHHVCGRCKMRLDVCPVCRALFFGTRNYAMEELIANFRKLRSFKVGAKSQDGSGSSETSIPAIESISGDAEPEINEDVEENSPNATNEPPQRAPLACKGLFRCLCCKNGNSERLPAGRLLNHLRYYHSPDLLEARSENGEYLQAWQFSTTPGKIVTAIRVADMGVFFLTIEFNHDSVYAWLSMATSPWIANGFNYTITICGNDREAIFSDSVWSVRSCEGSLKKRGHCLVVKDLDAEALLAPEIISGKLSVRRTPPDQLAVQTQPRAVLRIANRVNETRNLDQSFIMNIRNDVAELYRAFRDIDRETIALREQAANNLDAGRSFLEVMDDTESEPEPEPELEPEPEPEPESVALEVAPPPPRPRPPSGMSRNARRRMRLRARLTRLTGEAPETFSDPAPAPAPIPAPAPASFPARPRLAHQAPAAAAGGAAQPPRPTSPSPSGSQPQPANGTRNKKKRRHRR